MKLLSKSIMISCFGLLSVTQIASAHGALEDPMSRVYGCFEEGAENPTSDACKAAKLLGAGAQQFYDWNAVSQNAGGDDLAFVPDGQLCSAGQPRFAGADLARNDWPATQMSANSTYVFKYRQTAPHETTHFKYYVTKDAYEPTEPLKWDDLELFCEDGVQSAAAYHEKECVLPDKLGRHLIYTVWLRSDSPETFYSCSDVEFSQGEAGNTPPLMTVLSPQSNHRFIQEIFSPIKIEFDASDLDGEITEATVTIGDTIYYPEKLGERYTILWTPTSYGNYTIALKATDNDNSDVVRNRNITVSKTLNNVPTLNVVSPQNNQNFVQDVLSTITIAFDAQDSDGIVEHTMSMINGVHYEMNNIEDHYTLEWTPTSYGSHTIALHATDDDMASTMQSITVNILQEEIIAPIVPAWDTSSIYTAGDEVSYNNNIYKAKWWTKGDAPATQEWGPWEFIGSTSSEPDAVSDWNEGTVYVLGDKVYYSGKTYEAKWWTRGDTPGTLAADPWKEVSLDSGSDNNATR